MKRALLILTAILFVACAAVAQPTNVDIVYAADVPREIDWGLVTEDIDGNPFLPGVTITYEPFIYNAALFGSIDDQIVGNVTSMGVFAVPPASLDISGQSQGWYYVGIRTIADDGQGPLYSAIGWSYDDAITGPTQRFAWLVDQSPLGDPRLPAFLLTLPLP